MDWLNAWHSPANAPARNRVIALCNAARRCDRIIMWKRRTEARAHLRHRRIVIAWERAIRVADRRATQIAASDT